MGVSVTGLPGKLDLVPGEPATCQIVIRNTGTLVDDFAIEVLGDAKPWVQVVPSNLQLLPGTEGPVQLRLLPPRQPAPRAGPLPVQLRVTSKEDPESSAAADAVLAISAFGDIRAQLVPRTAQRRRSADFELRIANQGNDVISLQIASSDPDELLSFETVPPAVRAEPAQEEKATLRVRAKRRMLTGRPEPRPFETVVQDPRWPPVSVEATLVQKPLLPRWLVPILLVAGAAFALWLKTKVDNAGDVALLVVAAAVVAVVVAFLRKRRRKPKPPQ